MQDAVLIQKTIERQATAGRKLPSPLAQFRVFLKRGEKNAPNGAGSGIAQNPPKTPQGASAGDAGKSLPPTPAAPQGQAGDAPARREATKGAKKRGK